MIYKILGERHTGTNALAGFLRQNFTGEIAGFDLLGWKHRMAPTPREIARHQEVYYIVTVRHPYSWIKSMYKAPYNFNWPGVNKCTFAEFLERPFDDYENLLVMWNAKYDSYTKLPINKTCQVQMEDLVLDQKKLHRRFSRRFESRGMFTEFSKYVAGLGSGTKEVDKTYFKNKKWEVETPANIKKIVKHYIDDTLVKNYGYDLS